MLRQVVPEITTGHEVDHQIEVLPIVECVVHIDEEGVVKLPEEFLFVDNGVHAPLGNDPSLEHLLHGEQLMCLLLLDFPDLAEATTADNIEEGEVVLADLLDVLLALRFELTITHFSK